MGAGARAAGQGVPRVVLYTSGPDCSLCQRTELDLELLGEGLPFDLRVVDLRDAPEAADDYRDRVPVVLLDGHLVAEGRIELTDLRRALNACPSRETRSEAHSLGLGQPPVGRGPEGVDSRSWSCESDKTS